MQSIYLQFKLIHFRVVTQERCGMAGKQGEEVKYEQPVSHNNSCNMTLNYFIYSAHRVGQEHRLDRNLLPLHPSNSTVQSNSFRMSQNRSISPWSQSCNGVLLWNCIWSHPTIPPDDIHPEVSWESLRSPPNPSSPCQPVRRHQASSPPPGRRHCPRSSSFLISWMPPHWVLN